MKLNHLGGLVHGINSRTLRNAQDESEYAWGMKSTG